MSELCAICGRQEDEHCTFTPIDRPKGCVCNAEEWFDPANLPKVYESFMGDDPKMNCDRCEHDFECHNTALSGEDGKPSSEATGD